MKKSRLLNIAIFILICIVLISGCGKQNKLDNSSEKKAEPIVLKYNDINSPQSPQAMFGDEFARLVEEKTEGRVKIETYYGGSLAGYDIEPVQGGLTDFNQLIPSNVEDLEPVLSVLDAPYLYRDAKHLLKVIDPRSSVVEKINYSLKGKNVKFITALPMGMRHITSNKKITSLQDVKGLKLRVVPSKIYIDTISSFGAVPTPMAFSEVSTALVTGVIDGQENPFSVIVPNGIHEIQKYCIMTGHLPTLAGVFMNSSKFEKLSSKDQGLLLDAAVEARDKIAKYIEEKDKEWIDQATKQGMTIIDESSGLKIEEFKEKATEVHKKYESVWGDLYNEIIDMAE